MTKEELRESSEDGSIESKIDWKAVKADQFWYSPAGTVHAIGPGLVVIEIQQNVDLTYRLYDYGSARELHLDDGVAVANPVPYVAPFQPRELEPGRRLLSAEGAFVTERWTAARGGTLAASHDRPVWLVPLKGEGTLDGQTIGAGGVWLADSAVPLEVQDGIDLLVAYPGGAVNEALLG
jgi:mannose-6-phosphate isomerase